MSAVLDANLADVALFALLIQAVGYFRTELPAELASIGMNVYASPFLGTLLSGMFAGWLIALMGWLLPVAESGRVAIINLITYVVGLGMFGHIIAGSVNAFYVLIAGKVSVGAFVMRFLVPTLLGNAIGGVAFVAAVNHAQVSPPGDDSKRPCG